MITKLQITGKLHYHRKCDFQLSKRKLGYRTLLPLTAPIHATESCKETKRPPSSAITSERLNRLRLKRQVSVHSLAYVIGVLNQAICIAPFDPLDAGIPTRMYESPVCRANLDSPRPKPQDCFSVRHLDDRTDGVSQYRGETMSSSFEERSMHLPTVSAC